MRRSNPSITVDEIKERVRIPLVFIDEFSKSDESILLRNLVRTVLLPCIVASTNSKVLNMISSDDDTSRNERTNYCMLVRLFPSASIEGVLRTTNIKVANERFPFFDYINHETNQINFESLPENINDSLTEESRRTIQSIFNLIISQAATCHQGVVVICLEFLCNSMVNDPTNSHIFKALIEKLAFELSYKKTLSKKLDKLFFTLFTFALTPYLTVKKTESENDEEDMEVEEVEVEDNIAEMVDDDEDDEEDDFHVITHTEVVNISQGFASEAINGHYYHLGKDRNGPAVIHLKKSGTVLYESKMQDEFKVESYFSDFKGNSLMSIALWQSLVKDLNEMTVARVIKAKYNKSPNYFRNAFAQSNESDPQEFLAVSALAHASHMSLPHSINGIKLFEHFAQQFQTGSRNTNRMPVNLKSFLRRIKVPYLIPTDHDNPSLQNLRGFLELGECRRARNSEGVDVSFTIQNSAVNGFIECKNRKEAVSRSVALKYIVKAINSRRPLAILMGRKAGDSVKTEQEFDNFNLKKRNRTVPTSNLNLEQALALMNIKEPDFKMNVYSLTYDVKSPNTLKYAVLYEKPNPQGVFIIVESDCDFK